MADYFPLIARAVANLEPNTPEARRALYDRARAALVKQLDDKSLLERESIALDDAIRKVEATAPAAARPMTHEANLPNGFRDPRLLTRALQCLLAALIAITIAMLWSNVAQYHLLQASFTQAEAVANDARQHIIGIVYFAAFVTTAIVFGCWIHRASSNARALGASGMEFTPGWAVGYYFIPISCFWKPFQAMREIWKASKNPMHWHEEPTDQILGWWWFGWLGSNVLGQIDFRMSMSARSVSSLSDASVIGIIDSAFGVFSIPLALILVTRLGWMQSARQAAGPA
jgi:Domain of unknown function (DUF4328)